MNKDTIYENAFDKLAGIFKMRFDINKEFWNENNKKKHLLSPHINLNIRDLIYIYFDVEREFKISIPEDAVIEGCFCSFGDILEFVTSQLKQKHDIA